ncbi:MAG: transporter substrate-binding domain-containing protein [Deltaproteobacteria bacterium]|nr:transporter substrate-binding domain-containing protein [Deltaproteobacteria bacterium]
MAVVYFSCIFHVYDAHAEESVVITMGYRTNERAPLIGEAPDSEGLYYHLYSEAAKRIGCTIQVVRKPKKEILNDIRDGVVDFYPGFNFSKERSEFVYYIENGLPGGDVGLSLETLPEITDMNQLIDRDLTLLRSYGNARIVEGVKEIRLNELDLDTVSKLLINKRADFYIYNKSTLEYYLMKNHVKGFKLHPKCCGGIMPLYLAFSKKSPKFRSLKNENYKPEVPLSVENFPIKMDPQCVAAKFASALSEMKESGRTEKLYEQYYGYKMN